ncbi:MAG TPA: twin transmembrane helix small protein [Burkholderiales bacterium]|jgi:formate/nitrite transporter FocA (FNT family)|nr:twin transmembrane helix small protein [Burkholderiales bacterium]
MRILVLAIIALILISLGSALFFLVRDKGQSTRTVKALAVRVALSIALFLLLMIGYKLGFIPGRLT